MKRLWLWFSKMFTRLSAFFRRRRKNWGQVYYINGSEVLPAPLSQEEEAEILSALEEDGSLRAVLVERNLRLVVYIAKKFESTGICIEDLISIGSIGLMKAINTFRADKNIKLATYASRCIENEILMYIRKNSARRREVSFDEPLNVDWDGNELLLSDVLGSEPDVVCRRIEEAEERKNGTGCRFGA
jgi:RNA polymerase sporulation-specific sigma factor